MGSGPRRAASKVIKNTGLGPPSLRRSARRRTRLALLRLKRMTVRKRVLPDFLIIGAEKAGTTSAYAYLVGRPDVRPAHIKEVHYFGMAANYARGPDWYRANFPIDTRRTGRARTWITGEASTHYLFHPCVPERVAQLLPNVRLVAILRDPTERAISAYHAAVRRGTESRPMDVALKEELTRPIDFRDCEEFDKSDGFFRRQAYLSRGRYEEQLARWFDIFPREQMLVVETDSLIDPTQAALSALCGFLGLSAPGADSQLGWLN